MPDDLDQSQQEPEVVDQQEGQSQEEPSPDQAPLDQSEQEAQEASPDDKGEEPVEGEADKVDPPKPEAEKHKRRGGYERKIERLERQNQELIELLSRTPTQAQTPTAPVKDLSPAEKAAQEFQALVQRATSDELAKYHAKEQQRSQQSEFQKRVTESKAAHPDFDDVLSEVAHISVPPDLSRALLTSEKPGEIMYQLAKNPAELARISALPPLDAAREIGRLEAKFASGAAPQTQKPAARPPAPPSKVGGSSSPTRRLEDLPLAEYKRAYRSGRR